MKRIPNNIQEAVERCVEDVRKREPQLSIDRLGERVGERSWTIYKWMESGCIPLQKVMAFEYACGAHHVTRYLCAAANLLAVPMPTGRLPAAGDIELVQSTCSEAVTALLRYGVGNATVDATDAALTKAMGQLAAERANVQRSEQPELAFS